MTPRVTKEDLTRKARFIFQGSITQAATAGKGQDEESSVVVKVDSVLRAPDALADVVGSSVRVFLAPNEKVAKGDSVVFYTNPASWGESVSVRSLGHTTPEVVATRAHMAAPAKSLHDQQLEAQVKAADLVLTGTVSAVRLPPEETAPARLTAARTEPLPAERISEHDPVWREAVIDVHDVQKGSTQKQVVIRFPSSNDVRWHKAPKFRPGQQGVWLLQKKDIAQAPAAAALRRAAGVAETSAYTALHPADFQPIDQVESIKTLIKATKSNK
jgi:hypothetical protein